jgi:hypothetical protein
LKKDLDKKISGLADIIDKMSANQPKESDIMFGTVKTVSTKTLGVLIDGATTPSTIVRACNPAVGDRVVIVKKGTIWIAAAVRGGGSNLIKEVVTTTTTASITVDGLDINAHGGVYDVWVSLCASSNIQAGFKLNGTTGNAYRHEISYDLANPTTAWLYLGTNESFGIFAGFATPGNYGFSMFTISKLSNNRTFIDGHIDVFMSGQQVRYQDSGIVTASLSNITSLVFAPLSTGTFIPGSIIKVFRK